MDRNSNLTWKRLRRFLPETERDLARYTGALLYWATTATIVGASVIPALAPDDVNFWRLVLGVPALLIGTSILYVGSVLSERAFYWATVLYMIPGVAVNAVLLQITPASTAILANMIAPVIYTGYFMRRRELIFIMLFATGIALEPLYTEVPGEGQNLAAWLTVYIPTIWAVAIGLHLQKNAIQRALRASEEQALRDPLTGLANLRALQEAASAAFSPAAAPAPAVQQYAVMLVDIDNFKSANTLHGHLGGDRALRCIADQLRRVATDKSLVARVGGDEFAVLMPIESATRLSEHAEMFGASVRAAAAEMRLPGVDIDASVGCAVYPSDGTSLEALMTVADKAMYAEKSSHHARQPKPIEQFGDAGPNATAWIEDENLNQLAAAPNALVAWLRNFSLYARFSAVGWMFGCAATAISLAMPGADHAHLALATGALALGALFAFTMMLLNPQPLGRAHLAYDIITAGAIVFICAITGGTGSPSISLVYLFIVFQAWFWGVHKIGWRFATPVVIVLPQVIIEIAGGSTVGWVAAAAMYAAIVMSINVVLAMYFNQVYLRRIERRVQRLASTDPLTGIPNRRAFERFVEEQLTDDGRERGDREFAVVMIDLDNFKDVNTAHGHRTGDLLLCDIAVALQSAARQEDCVARVGGDEFAAVLPATGIDGARSLAERFVAAVAECAESSDGGASAAVTASAGFALCPLHGDTLDELVRSADDALMRVKADEKGTARVSRLIAVI